MFGMIHSSPQETIPSFNEGRAEQSQRAGKKLRQTDNLVHPTDSHI